MNGLSDFAFCILIYVLYTLVFAVWHILIWGMNKNNKRFNKTYFKIFVVIWWVTHIFNIVYTGLLGWNAHPGSELEQWLDNISVSSFISDLIILFRAMHEPVKQEKKVGNRK